MLNDAKSSTQNEMLNWDWSFVFYSREWQLGCETLQRSFRWLEFWRVRWRSFAGSVAVMAVLVSRKFPHFLLLGGFLFHQFLLDVDLNFTSGSQQLFWRQREALLWWGVVARPRPPRISVSFVSVIGRPSRATLWSVPSGGWWRLVCVAVAQCRYQLCFRQTFRAALVFPGSWSRFCSSRAVSRFSGRVTSTASATRVGALASVRSRPSSTKIKVY